MENLFVRSGEICKGAVEDSKKFFSKDFIGFEFLKNCWCFDEEIHPTGKRKLFVVASIEIMAFLKLVRRGGIHVYM